MPLTNYPFGDEYLPTPQLLTDISRAQNGSVSPKYELWIDFETFYAVGYSLKSQKYNYTEYVRDPKFAVMCVAVKIDSNETRHFTADEFLTFSRTWDWANTCVYAHNMMFDGLILSEKYNVRPAKWRCTLSLIRALFQGSIPADIDSMAELLGLPGKSGILTTIKGKHFHELTQEEREKLLSYCVNDVNVSHAIMQVFGTSLPPDEWKLMELTLQQFLEPKMFVDRPRLERELQRVKQERADLIAATGVENLGKKTAEDRFRSLDLFNDLIVAAGATLPIKWSNKQEKDVIACSKSDLAWLRLMHEWETTGQTHLTSLAKARMNCSSSTHITRPQRLLNLSEGNRPIGAAYNYYGAHTGRWSGANKLNKQNFKRKGEIRKCIVAPKGYVFGVVDASQIELRFNAWFNDQIDVLETLRQGRCVYRKMAGQIYGLPEHIWLALASDSPERFLGKVAELGLGYQMSGPKFNDTLALGSMGPAVFMTQEQTNHIVYNVYRPQHQAIVDGWRRLDEELAYMMNPNNKREYKCVEFRHNQIILPNGMPQVYNGLHFEDARTKTYFADGFWHGIYGGLADENIIQALARIPMGDAMRTINPIYPIVMHTHDELTALIPEREADQGLQFMIDTLSTPPSWARDIPLKAEGGYDYCYSK